MTDAVGCGTHHAAITDRRGRTVAEAEVLTKVSWSRRLDMFGVGALEIVPSAGCCGDLGNIRSWHNSMQIWRNGKFVFGGPITGVGWGTDTVQLAGTDVLGWLARRAIHKDQNYRATDLVTIAAGLIEDGYAPDDPGHNVVIKSLAKVNGTRSYYRDASYVLDELVDLADQGLDFTAIGDQIMLMGEDFAPVVGTLTDADFPEGLNITDDGISTATRWIVHGGQATSEGERPAIIGTADSGQLPLVEQIVTESGIRSNSDAVAAARSRLASSWPVPLFVDTSQEKTLSPEAAVDVTQLVPGWAVDVHSNSTCRPISTRMKIQGVKVVETGDEGESVSVQLAPIGGMPEGQPINTTEGI